MSKQTKWFFPTTDRRSQELEGLNEPGISQFQGMKGSLAREAIQNSLDKRVDDSKPVVVVFERLELEKSQIPGFDDLCETLTLCRKRCLGGATTASGKTKSNTEEFFDSADKMIARKTIPVLKVGDYNTTGLVGKDGEQKSPYSRLIWEPGMQSDVASGVGGGSWGIGQSAPFAVSALRTVFYSTVTSKSSVAFVGRSILSGFQKGKHKHTRKGYFGVPNKDGVICAVREKNLVPAHFRRAELGLDLYIVGFDSRNWADSTKEDILDYFFAAVEAGMLVVQIKDASKKYDLEINRENLKELLSLHNEEAKYFHEALTDPENGKPFTRVINRLGEVQLYVKKGIKGARNLVCRMRQPRMVVSSKSGRSSLEGYAAVLLCSDPTGNLLLRNLEGFTHTDWDFDGHNETALRKELNDFIKETLNSLAGPQGLDSEEIDGLADFLPDGEDPTPGAGAATSDGSEPDKTKEDKNPTGFERLRVRASGYAKPWTAPVPAAAKSADDDNDGEGGGVPPPKSEDGGEGTKHPGGAKPGAGPGNNPSGTGGKSRKPSSKLPKNFSFRAIPSSPDSPEHYRISIHSSEDWIGDFKLSAEGDDGTYEVSINQATYLLNKTKISTTGVVLHDIKLSANAPTVLSVTLETKIRLKLFMEFA